METTSQVMERLNRRAWSGSEAVRWYANAEGFLDPGEQAAFKRLTPDARDNPVLDLGIGGGRTTAQFLPLTRDYIGIDYTPAMVETCKRKFEGVRFEHADARDLSRFPAASFQLVVFSYNGIDAVDLEGRQQVLAEAWRVLRPGGAFFFSTFNRQGPDFEAGLKLSRGIEFTWNPIKLAARTARFVVSNTVSLARQAINRRHEQHEAGHDILMHSAHDGIMVYATTSNELEQQLAAAGFVGQAEVLGSKRGELLTGTFAKEEYVHVIARKAA